jgi:uncharacterized protein YfiM (DUF2279 family)
MRKLVGLIVVCFCINVFPQRISMSAWDSKSGEVIKYDKIEHFVGSFLLYDSFRLFGVSENKSIIYSIGLGFAWEIKDSFVPREKYGAIGGEGFCYKDFAADVSGVILSYAVNKAINKVFR